MTNWAKRHADGDAGALRLAVAASIAAHLTVVVTLGWFAASPQSRRSDAPDAVDVEIVLAQPEPPPSPAASPAPAPINPPALPATIAAPSPATIAPPHAAALTHAQRLTSASALADPRSRGTREMLRRSSAEDRAIQLCGLEAMGQVGVAEPALAPDRVIAYARGDVQMRGARLIADGAAVHGGTHWRAMRFECELSADRARVVDFAFALGDDIPRSSWEEIGLPSEGAR